MGWGTTDFLVQPTTESMETFVAVPVIDLGGRRACVAPTQIFPGPLGLANKGVSWGTFPFFLRRHDRR